MLFIYHKYEHDYNSKIKKQNVPSLSRGQDNGTKKLIEVVKAKLIIILLHYLHQ